MTRIIAPAEVNQALSAWFQVVAADGGFQRKLNVDQREVSLTIRICCYFDCVSDLEQYTPLHQRNFMQAVEIITCTERSSPFPHFSQKFQIKPWVLNYGGSDNAVEEFKVLSSCCTMSRDMKKVEKTFNVQKCGLFINHFVIVLNFTMLQKLA